MPQKTDPKNVMNTGSQLDARNALKQLNDFGNPDSTHQRTRVRNGGTVSKELYEDGQKIGECTFQKVDKKFPMSYGRNPEKPENSRFVGGMLDPSIMRVMAECRNNEGKVVSSATDMVDITKGNFQLKPTITR